MALRFSILALFLSLTSCYTAEKEWRDTAIRNNWTGDHIRRASVEAAVIKESALYSHHFMTGSTKLTQIGSRDVDILSRHFLEAPGALVVKRGDASEELYEARLEAIKEKLLAAGVDSERFTVSDGHPGGRGTSTNKLIEVFEKESLGADAVQATSLVNTAGSN